MNKQERRLIGLDLNNVPSLTTDIVVVGSGIAGLAAALAAAEHANVIIATKDIMSESNSNYAQGGIAAAMAEDDRPDLHIEDTLHAGAGLCDPEAVKILVEEGIERCRELINLGLPFDRNGDKLAFTMEGAHCRRRVIHASGDATGRVITESMLKMALENPNIRILEQHFTIDLLHESEECYGVILLDTNYGRLLKVEAEATIVASGGLGQVYRETTNPEVATADGYALCYRAGAILRDMEFVQFHPTTLYLAGAPRFLISEAVRGEGAYLLNERGERFMEKYSDMKELAPRDVVSQAIFKELNDTGTSRALLDLRHIDPQKIEKRFPTIMQICSGFGINIKNDLVPVRPAVHYMMGGVKTGMHGETNVKRLFAAGEVASTGVHGANRLASNSLLEALVFGHRAGKTACELRGGDRFHHRELSRTLDPLAVPLNIADMLHSLKSLTWRLLGVYREEKMLQDAEQWIKRWEGYVLPEQFQMRGGFEMQNMLTTAKLIARGALTREESRGAHQRFDFQDTKTEWEKHTELSISDFE